ncbi:PREDICTED: uncharacterized protein LOC108694069 [Atta colombica]|uniref:uncharacterized protein LOC108694069 n=1 Tax=Atta colombica TaxID=520822 RepID=UPI00084C06A8|nr:PREDICTED: uncharacterized protein LOC108694069 [Atta colombica]
MFQRVREAPRHSRHASTKFKMTAMFAGATDVACAPSKAAYRSLVREYYRSEEFDSRVFSDPSWFYPSPEYHPCAQPERTDVFAAHCEEIVFRRST